MPERKGKSPKRMYSDEDIARVKTAIEKDPALGCQIIDSAQQGNEGDIRFILESGLTIFSDSPTESTVSKMPKT